MHGSDEVHEHTCDLCIQDNQVKEAKAFCTVCMEYFCSDCHKVHSRAKISKTHRVLTGNDMSEVRIKLRYAVKCDKHPDSDLNIFCCDHKSVCCAKCKVLEHRSCNKTVKIKEFSDKQDSGNNSLKLYSLKCILNEFKRMLTECDTLKSDLESQGSDIIKKIEMDRKQINEKLDRLQSDVISTVDEKLQIHTADLEMRKNDITCFVDELTKQVAEHEDRLNTGADEQVIITSLVMESEIENFKSEARQFYDSFNKIEITFSLDTYLRDINENVNEFGMLKIDISKAEIQRPHWEREIVFLRDIDCKLPSDEKQVGISDLEILPDGKVIVSDMWNLKIKLFDSDSKLLSEVKVSSTNWNMAVMTPRNIVVTLPDETCLQHISIEDGDDLKVTKRYQTKNEYTKLAKIDHNIIALWSDADNLYFDLIDINGSYIRRVKKEPRKDGLFSSVSSFCLSPDDTVIYVVDGNNGCIGMSLSGEVAFRLKNDKICSCDGVCAISDDCICLSGFKSHNIVLVQIKDEKMKEIVKPNYHIGMVAWSIADSILLVQLPTEDVMVFSLI